MGRSHDAQVRVRERLRADRLARWYSDASERLRTHPDTTYDVLCATMLRKWTREVMSGETTRFPEAHQVLAAAFLAVHDPSVPKVYVAPEEPLGTVDVQLTTQRLIGPGEATAWCILASLLTAGLLSNPVLVKYFGPALVATWAIVSAFIYLRVRP